MRKQVKTNTKNRRMVVRLIIVLAILVYAVVHYVNQQSILRELQVKRTENEARIAALNEDIAFLEREIHESESLEFVERVARDDLGMVRPREIIYSDEAKDQEEEQQETEETPANER